MMATVTADGLIIQIIDRVFKKSFKRLWQKLT